MNLKRCDESSIFIKYIAPFYFVIRHCSGQWSIFSNSDTEIFFLTWHVPSTFSFEDNSEDKYKQ